MNPTPTSSFKGLTDTEAAAMRQQFGNNNLDLKEKRVFLQVLKEVALEPMFVLLLAACIIYFLLQEYTEGIIMLCAICIVAGISFFQEYRSRNAVAALRKMSDPLATVLRNENWVKLATEELVVKDIIQLDEGMLVPADGVLLAANDFSVNESILTGESFAVDKSATEKDQVYKGTLVVSGSATVQLEAVGLQTKFGKIGASLQQITVEKTPLQIQIRAFVRQMVWVGSIAFIIVVVWSYIDSGSFTTALLRGLTLAMSVLPEEIPVAFSTFQALGAFRLLRRNIIVKQPQYVETLGAATVICADKTGTLTRNEMNLAWIYDAATGQSFQTGEAQTLPAEVLEYAMWASETQPFDPMEQAIHTLYSERGGEDKRPAFMQIHEYPIGGKPPMMTHIFKNEKGDILIAAKGAPEAIIALSKVDEEKRLQIESQVIGYAKEGLRVLGVGKGEWQGTDWPKEQQAIPFRFLGLVAFNDPPKTGMRQTLQEFEKAGIQFKMITGDYAETASAIAKAVQMDEGTRILTGNEVMEMPMPALAKAVGSITIFARMFPEAKLKVIEALKDNGEIVAMTGDGVNDGPALKAAHIGIAMGKRGSEVAKAASALILSDDDLGHMTEAVSIGRRIYDNLQKAIQYIVSIHIPIILIVLLPLVLMWTYSDIFTPIHVIFLELIMGPTCSIIYENEPMEPGTMSRPPRAFKETFLSGRQLMISIIQGLVITAGCLGLGYYYMQTHDEIFVRSVIFTTLLFSNIFLTLVNRSFTYTIATTLRYKNMLVPLIIGITLLLMAALQFIPAIQRLFDVTQLPLPIVLISASVAIVATGWVEIWKLIRLPKGKFQPGKFQ